MNLTVNAADLARQATWIARAVPPSRSVPVLGAVEVTALVGGLRLRRTDYEVFVEAVLDADGGANATILIDPGNLVAQLKPIAKTVTGVADLTITDTHLTISSAERTVKLKAMNVGGAEFPTWPKFIPDDADETLISARQLARALVSIGTDDTLPALTALRFDEGMMVSTNRIRLSRIRYDREGGITASVSGAALRPFAAGDEAIFIEGGRLAGDGARIGIGALRLRSADERISITRVLDADFPKWQNLIPESAAVSVMFRRRDLLAAMGKGEDVTLTLEEPDDEGQGVMRVVSTDRAGDTEIEQSIEVTYLAFAGELPFTVRLARTSLEECAKGIASGALQLDANHPHKPVVLTGAGYDDDFHMMMPIRMPA